MISLVVDGNYLLHRCMRVKSLSMLTSSDGIPSGGIFGFLKSLRSSINYLKANKVIVVFDGGISERRRSIFPAYKGSKYRSKDDPLHEEIDQETKDYLTSLHLQRKSLQLILRYLGVPVVRLRGWEGDDLVYRISRHHTDPGVCYIMSDDKDYFQAIGEYKHFSNIDLSLHIMIYRPIADVILDESNFDQVVGYPLDQFLLRKSILGDPSDNLPGVPGVGPKGLDNLFNNGAPVVKFPFEDFFCYCMTHKSKKFNRIFDHVNVVLNNYELMNLMLEEYPLGVSDDVNSLLKMKLEINLDGLEEQFMKFQFRQFLIDIDSWLLPFQRLLG